MDIVEIYFAFHRPATLRELITRKSPVTSMFGHVEAFGYTIDNTWFFFDPGSTHTKLLITHMNDEINDLMQKRFDRAQTVFRLKHDPDTYPSPIHGPMNCVTQCAALIGWRAFTPGGFRKKLLNSNAEVIHEKHAKGRSRSQSPA